MTFACKDNRRPRNGLYAAVVAFVLALAMALMLVPVGSLSATPVEPPAWNVPDGWPWMINNLVYPTLGYPQILKKGTGFTLEFDYNGRGRGSGQPDVADWDVRLLSSNEQFPTIVDCDVLGARREVSSRWNVGNLPPSSVNGEYAGPWAGKEVWKVTVQVPNTARSDLYDLYVRAEGAQFVSDTQPHAVQVIDEFKDDYNFVQLSDFHINDPRGPDFPWQLVPNPAEFKNYVYNQKAIQDVNAINPDFATMTGDDVFGCPPVAGIYCPLTDPDDKTTDHTGAAPDWDGEYVKAYRQLMQLDVPIVCIPGNHDTYNLQDAWSGAGLFLAKNIADGAHVYTTMIGPRFFGWDYGDKLHITCFDSSDKIQRDTEWWPTSRWLQRSYMTEVPSLDGGCGWILPNQKYWMLNDLAAVQGRYKAIAMACHAPFYGDPSMDTWWNQKIIDEMQGYTHAYNVNFVLSGHVHRDDIWVDGEYPGKPVYHLNTTTTSFGTIEYPGFRRVFMKGGSLGDFNYRPDRYSYPTYANTQIKIHASGKEAQAALAPLTTPSTVGGFLPTPSDSDKTYTCTNNFTAGDPPVNLDNTVVEFNMADLGYPGRYRITGGTLVDAWNPADNVQTLRVRLDGVPPGGTVNTRVSPLYISSITPTSGKAGETMDVDIEGHGTNFVQGTSAVIFSGGGVRVNATQVIGPTHIKANVTIDPGAQSGQRDVNVTTGSETPYMLPHAFLVKGSGAYIEACRPTEVVQGHKVDLQVLGGNTHFQQGESKAVISGTGVTPGAVAVDDQTHAVTNIVVDAAATPGERDVNITTGGEVPVPLVGGLMIHEAPTAPPFIHSITPAEATVGTEISIKGGNFGRAMGSSRVLFNGVPATKYFEWSDNEVECSVPLGATTGNVTVETPWGTSEGEPFKVNDLTFDFAEGTCRPWYTPYFSILNPGDGTADTKITYMRSDGTTREQTLEAQPRSRTTVCPIDLLGTADSAGSDFSSKVECTNGQMIIVERPMYFKFQNHWPGGSDAIGAPSPSAAFYFAEGTCRPNFMPYICIQNPGDSEAQVKITYMTGDGANKEQQLAVLPHSRMTVAAKDVLGEGDDAAHDFSTKVECTNGEKIVAERPMYFSYQGQCPGGHDVVGASQTRDSFLFAEGTTRPYFDPYFCMLNPNGASANIKVTFMKGDGTTTEKTLTIPPKTRATLRAKDVLGEGDDPSHDFSARVESTNALEIVVERPMYFSYGRKWAGGSNAIGAGSDAARFYLAEGTTRPNFDSYICIQNPQLISAQVKVTYMRGDGNTEEQTVKVPAQSRYTIKANDALGGADGPASDFSATVETLNNVGIVVERPMYFAYQGWCEGGHDVVGFSP